MKTQRLLFLLNGMDDQWLEEAEQYSFYTFRKKRFACILIAAVLLLTTAVLAVHYGWSAALVEYLHPTQQQMEVLEGNTQSESLSVTQNGVTLTVLQTLTDQNGVYVLYQIDAPQQIDLRDDFSWRDYFLMVPTEDNRDGVTIQTAKETLLNRTANSFTMLLSVQSSTPLKEGTIHLFFQDIGYFANQFGFHTVVSGTWELEYPIVYSEIGKTVNVERSIEIGSGSYSLSSVYLSPLSLLLNFEGDYQIPLDSVILQYRDGHMVTYSGEQIHFLHNMEQQKYKTHWSCFFPEIISLDDLESIQIGDYTFQVH